MRRLGRYALGVVGAVLAVGLVIHLPPVMHWLAAHGHHGAGVCPLGYGKSAVAASSPVEHPEPALGFELGRTTATDVTRYGLEHGVWCSRVAHGGALECASIASDDLTTTLWFDLDSSDVVRGIRTTRRGNVESIASKFAALASELSATHGTPTAQSGSAQPADLARGALRQAMVQFRGPYGRAEVRATNMGDGFVLTERYALVN